jgi:hypothetical protein
MRNDPFSFVIGDRRRGAAAAMKSDSPPTAVRTTPDPAALRKFLRE